jgi:hypothetical protein
MKTYAPAPADIEERVVALVVKHYPDLLKYGIRIDVVAVTVDDKDASAVQLHGYECLGTMGVVPVKHRALGRGDAELLIDLRRYREELASDAARDAFLDHELYHLMVIKEGPVALTDSANRPRLKIRKHDRQFGWFDEIARRHGGNAFEVRQAQRLAAEAGQIYFGFIDKQATA